MSIDNILQSLSKYKEDNFPPVHLWNPELCTNASFSIDIKGDWYYNNSIIGRLRLKKLFSTILKREGDDYFLVTPVEKIKLDVEIAPPLVKYIAKQLKELGYKPGIVSRGYGGNYTGTHQVTEKSTYKETGDEAQILSKLDMPFYLDRNRPRAVKSLVKNNDCDVVIADDQRE